jgi:hypothetical protein
MRFALGASLVGAATLVACRVEGVEDLVRPLPTSTAQLLGAVQKSSDPRCAAAPSPSALLPDSPGHVVFRLPDKHDYRLEARDGAEPEDITNELDAISPGADGFINASADGQWLLVETTRFGCGQDMCLAVIDRSACTAQVIVSGREAVHAGATGAIGEKGEIVVYPAEGGGHPSDLFAVTRQGDGWSEPLNLTKDSAQPYNQQPTLSADARSLLFDCGPDPGSGDGTAICQVATNGQGLHVAAAPDELPGRISANHHAAFAPDGSLVFEATWNGGAEQVWRKRPGAPPELVNREQSADGTWRFTDDNSPCVLPDGRVVSLWLGREATGAQAKPLGHELKIMNADGGGFEMLVIDVDVVDIGIGCNR